MKVNKNQALYRYLPNAWVTYSDSKKTDYKYACKIEAWNIQEILGINKEMIKKDIARRINSFRIAGGVVKEDFSDEEISKLLFVKAALNDPIPDIVCKINPATYYCSKCGTVTYAPKKQGAPECFKCKKRMNQLQMVYACECGYAEGVKPLAKQNEKLFYHAREKNNQFKFFTEKGIKKEMLQKCPICGKMLTPKNAIDTRIFYPQSGSFVNLYNEAYVNILEKYKNSAEELMIAKWFNILTQEDFIKILEDPKNFFEYKSKSVNDSDVITFAEALSKSPEEIVAMLGGHNENAFCIQNIETKINQIIPLEKMNPYISCLTSNLLEYDILKNPKEKIDFKDAVKKGIEIGEIIDEDDINELINKLHIKNIQVSEAVEIVNYSYGFTRLHSCPDDSVSGNSLCIRGFDGKVFTNILETEGVLVNIDLLAIFNWLVENKIINGDENIDNEIDAKTWFVENIDLAEITHFNEISTRNIVTKVVYSLLHTISHMMIISAGKNSGLSKDSMSELIFPNTGSFFIYPISSEGITLGSISGMFETKLNKFLEDTLKENEICTFDPICTTIQNGACIACCYLSEANCVHFNKDLSRTYLYGGKIKIAKEEIEIIKGFWK